MKRPHSHGCDLEVAALTSSPIASSTHYAAVRQLFQEHNRALIKFLLTRLSSEQEAIDVAQEAYVRLLQLHRPETIGFLRGYLFKIAANLSVDRIRQRAVREGGSFQFFDEPTDSRIMEDRAISDQEFEVAWRALAEVPEMPRRAFVLRFVEDYSAAEIAQIMKVDERTVRKYITRALVHCRERMSCSDARNQE
jgi:RNA polymerase sigma factor (sigma-70 family)